MGTGASVRVDELPIDASLDEIKQFLSIQKQLAVGTGASPCVDEAQILDEVKQLLSAQKVTLKATSDTILPPATTRELLDVRKDAEDSWSDDEDTKESGELPLELDIFPDSDVDNDSEGDKHVMIRIKVPDRHDCLFAHQFETKESESREREAMDICCVVDISGSMRNGATYEVDGVLEDNGLSYLDIVKHAVKAVLGILKDRDRFALVAFDQHAEVAFELDYVTDVGREKAIQALDKLAPRGKTDIWAGVLAGMDALRAPPDPKIKLGQTVVISRESRFRNKKAIVLDPEFKDSTIQVQIIEGDEKGAIRSYHSNELMIIDPGWRRKSILLLTDGQVPEYHQPLPKLQQYKESHPDFHFQLNTFGFGYDLDSQMLHDLAVEGHGTFAFIPDAVIVGTCFINSICNALSTQTQNAVLHLQATDEARIVGPVIGFPSDLVVEASWGHVVNLGPLQFGQNREIVIPMRIPAGEAPYLRATLVYAGSNGKPFTVEGIGTHRKGGLDAKVAACRSLTVKVGYEVIDLCARSLKYQDNTCKAKRLVEELQKTLESIFPYDAKRPNFTADVDGRMMKAIDGMDRFHRWGKHYLRALVRAHQLQVCTNFMDPGLQDYGGDLFCKLRAAGDEIFRALPAPRPTRRNKRVVEFSANLTSSLQSTPNPASPNMATYYAGSGGG